MYTPTEQLLTEREASTLLNVSMSLLQKNRMLGKPPRYLKLGGAVRYRFADIQEFIESSCVDLSIEK